MTGAPIIRQACLPKAYNPADGDLDSGIPMTRPPLPSPITVLWRRLDHPGLEYCWVHESPVPAVCGTVLALPDESPMRVEYAIRCTGDWRTVLTRVELRHRRQHTIFELACDDRLRWFRDGAHLPALDGCEDVDLSVTPSTNTLPIRRLALEVGEAREVTAAWIRFPTCEIAPLPQRYGRIADRRYRYESRGGEFTAELEVDEHGLVVDYPPAWERVRR
jgi:hypothetical protein